jgi:hypothetical protein
MVPQNLSQTQQSLSATLPGTWKLAAGRAITLRPREAGILRVAHGQMWATFDGPHAGGPTDQGDHVIGAGGELRLRAGQRLVMEAWSARTPAYFSWDPLPVPARVVAPGLAPVLQPLADLRTALALGGGALGRLMAGLASVAWDLVTGGERRSRACGAHGAMG